MNSRQFDQQTGGRALSLMMTNNSSQSILTLQSYKNNMFVLNIFWTTDNGISVWGNGQTSGGDKNTHTQVLFGTNICVFYVSV